MNLRTLAIAVIATSAALLSGNAASAGEYFVESDTSAALVGGGDDSVLTVVRAGVQEGNLSYAVGAGYNSNGDEAVVNGLVEYTTRIANKTYVGVEVEANYGLDSDELSVAPELRIRRYF